MKISWEKTEKSYMTPYAVKG